MQNYRQYLKDGGEEVLQKVYYTGAITYRCEKCNKPVDAVCLVNVTSLGNISDGKTWVCDQCRLDWKRAKTPIDSTDEFFVPAEWDVKFLEKVGCWELDYIATKKYAVRHVKNRYNDIRKDPRYEVEKAKIEQKYGNPATLPKNKIRANNKEESVLSNIPENSSVFIDGQKVAENINSLTFTTINKGKYKVKIISDFHLDFEGDIDAY